MFDRRPENIVDIIQIFGGLYEKNNIYWYNDTSAVFGHDSMRKSREWGKRYE